MFEALVVGVVALNVWADFMDRRAAVQSDVNALSLWTTIVQFLLVVPLFGLVGAVTMPQLALCALIGALSTAGRATWYRALGTSERLSRLAPFSRISSVMVLAMAVLILGESAAPSKIAGGLILIAGAFMMSWRGPVGSIREYLASNKALVLVAIFAVSTASVSVFYRHMMLAGVSIITTYFFLKLCQLCFAVLHALRYRYLIGSHTTILDLQLFVQARAIQTAAALLYIFVLRQIDLTRVEPVAAASGPLLFLAIEKVSDWRARYKGEIATDVADKRDKHQAVRNFGLATIVLGIFVFAGG
jgi:uncharacterized membrane protein